MIEKGRYVTPPPAEIAVSADELSRWGCPNCGGYRSGSVPIQQGGTALWRCGDCGASCYVLADGVTESSFGGSLDGSYTLVLPLKDGGEPSRDIKGGGELFKDVKRAKLQPHPRRGTSAHGQPDTRPEGDGEFFHSRGLGTDMTPGCFVCGGERSYYSNIAAFVQCKEAGERVVSMFKSGARLDYRDFEPDRVQVKIGACSSHRANLEALHRHTGDVGGKLTMEILELALKGG